MVQTSKNNFPESCIAAVGLRVVTLLPEESCFPIPQLSAALLAKQGCESRTARTRRCQCNSCRSFVYLFSPHVVHRCLKLVTRRCCMPDLTSRGVLLAKTTGGDWPQEHKYPRTAFICTITRCCVPGLCVQCSSVSFLLSAGAASPAPAPAPRSTSW